MSDMSNARSEGSARGWGRLQNDRPEVVALREQLLSWLKEVEEPCQTQWSNRLKSNNDHSFYPVVLELFLHHSFVNRGWQIAVEPQLVDTSKRPDFLLKLAEERVIVEAKVLFDSPQIAIQDNRFRELSENLSKKLNLAILIHPRRLPPYSLPSRSIADQIERKARDLENAKYFTIKGKHQGCPYELEVTVLDSVGEIQSGVMASVGQWTRDTACLRLREAIQEKAGKYGVLGMPFVVTVWPSFPYYAQKEHDIEALLGDVVWELDWGTEEFSRRHSPNGIFTEMKDGKHRWAHVSAVATCQPTDAESTPTLYHNPHTTFPMTGQLFEGWQQYRLA